MKPSEIWKHTQHCRKTAAVKCSDNIYEQIRVRIVRVMRESEYVDLAARHLGVSATTVRKYLRFVPFEHLLRNPALADRFDWRSMTSEKWVRLLRKHPQFIERLPKGLLYKVGEKDILIAQPQLVRYFDLRDWNLLEMDFCWSDLLQHRPELAVHCDFSVITGLAAKYLLCTQPQFFDRIRIETLLPYHWDTLLNRQPHLKKKMNAMPHADWPFNYWVYALQVQPELESEFTQWDRIDPVDVLDIKTRQPAMYRRHWLDDSKN